MFLERELLEANGKKNSGNSHGNDLDKYFVIDGNQQFITKF